jgi:hypothetical protein
MFNDAAPFAGGGMLRSKASAVVALDLALTSPLDVERLAGPQLAPALAGRMRYDRVRPGIEPSVAGLIPRLYVR